MTSKLFSRRALWAILALVVALMAAGSVWDWQVSCALYDPTSAFGRLLAAFGMYPTALGLAAAGELLLLGHDRGRRVVGALQRAGGLLLVCAGVKLCAEWPEDYLGLSGTASLTVAIIVCAAALLVLWRVCQGASQGELLRLAAALLIAIAFEYVLINAVVKGPWARARFRLVMSDERAYFMPWWHAGDPLKETLVSAGVDAEEFRSFPSGHTGCATAAIMLGFLPRVSKRLRGREKLLTGIGLAWTALVALSRIIVGAHYLTDVTMGFAIGLLGILLAEWLIWGRHAQKASSHGEKL